MASEEVTRLLDAFEAAGVSVWIDGGWGVDALFGEQLRSHDDLDIVVEIEVVRDVKEVLRHAGYTFQDGDAPLSFMLVDPMGRQVDVHPVRFDDRGTGLYQMGEGRTWTYPAEGLAGTGHIGGKQVRCLTPELQMRVHSGYELGAKDREEIRALQERFGVDPPRGYVRTTSRGPARSAISAFGGDGEPALLDGGQGKAWRVGSRVIKPLDLSVEELAWQYEALNAIRPTGVRVARPIRAANGAVVVDGWCAWGWVDGRHEKGRWMDVIAAGERFHAALSSTPMPDFIRRRDDPWSIGDRVAWGEQEPTAYLEVEHLPELLSALRPVRAKSQLIHGDLTGNVLFSEELAPAVIDFSPYWRPTTFASAIVVADALIWEEADERLLTAVADSPDIGQYVLRALIYRIVTDAEFRRREVGRPSQASLFTRAVELVRDSRRADA